MKKTNGLRGLSDRQLAAVLESLPEGMALVDADGRSLWANRIARQLLALRATTSPADETGTELVALVSRLMAEMPAYRGEEHARWTIANGGAVTVTMRRVWASQLALRLLPSPELTRPADREVAAAALSSWQIIVAERLLEEAAIGLVVADSAGRIRWMNPQARRLLAGAKKRVGRDAERDVARAARHVAVGRLRAPIRMHVELPTNGVEALFWNPAPGLAGVLFDEDYEMRAVGGERLIA